MTHMKSCPYCINNNNHIHSRKSNDNNNSTNDKINTKNVQLELCGFLYVRVHK